MLQTRIPLVSLYRNHFPLQPGRTRLCVENVSKLIAAYCSSTMPKNKSGGDTDDTAKFELSKNKFATVSEFKGKVRVDIREYYMTDDGEKRPGKKGINLSIEEWKKLTSQLDDIENKIKEVGGGTITSDSDSSSN